MALNISNRSIDAGIVTRNLGTMLAFYQDLLGLETEDILGLPGGGIMHRLRAGDSLIKLLDLSVLPTEQAKTGGIVAASGLRYLTIQVSNLEQATNEIKAAGNEVLTHCKALRPGVVISIVQDPEGNLLELVEYQ
jgi:predicted enzyme related to lactoylglutathione lyase